MDYYSVDRDNGLILNEFWCTSFDENSSAIQVPFSLRQLLQLMKSLRR